MITQRTIRQAVEQLMKTHSDIDYRLAYRTVYEVYGLIQDYDRFREATPRRAGWNRYNSFLSTLPR